MIIAAAFDKALFYSAANKYSVLRFKTADMMVPDDAREPVCFADHLIRFVAVGFDLPQTDTVQIELDGEWETGKYGRRFHVQTWREIVPPTEEGILQYLSSGLLKGIGEKTAEAIVQKFDVDSLNILEKQPEKLLEIKGITPERLEEIKAGYAESTQLRGLMTTLAPFRITPSIAVKILDFFGPNSVGLLRESPYRLCQIPGFGFERVDAIVRKSGGDLHAPFRIQGAIFYTLEQSRNGAGHLYMDAGELVKAALFTLNSKIPQSEAHLNTKQITKELTAMIQANIVVCNQGNIYLPHVFAQERETACKIASILLEKPKPVNLSPVMQKVKDNLAITLSPKQAEGVEIVFRHNLSIITGGPGTGKSTILKAVIEAYRQIYPNRTIMTAI